MTLKIKWSVILPAKNGFVWEQQRIAIQDKQAVAKAVGKSNKGKGFMEKNKKVGSGCLEQKSVGGK